MAEHKTAREGFRGAAEKEAETQQERIRAADAEQRQRIEQDPGHGRTVAPSPRNV